MGLALLWCLILAALQSAIIALTWALLWNPQPHKPSQQGARIAPTIIPGVVESP